MQVEIFGLNFGQVEERNLYVIEGRHQNMT